MKRANNIVEMSLLASVIVVVALVAFTMYNNQKMKLANLSKSNISSQTINLTTASEAQLEDTVKYNKIETAGTNALTHLGVTSTEYESAMSSLTYDDLKEAATGGSDDLFKLANDLITKLNLNYTPISAENVTTETLTTITKILNAASAAIDSSSTATDVKELATTYVNQVKSILD